MQSEIQGFGYYEHHSLRIRSVDHLRDVILLDWATTEMNLSENQARQCLFPKSECDSAGFLYRRKGMTFIMRDQVIELFSKGMRTCE